MVTKNYLSTSNFQITLLKFYIVDSVVNILGDLFEQPLIMWVFIGWGWLAAMVMLFSVYDTIGQL